MTGDGVVTGAPRLILRAEGAALLLVAAATYAHLGASWWLFAILLLAPDLAMLGYLAGPGAGAAVYNAAHTTVVPLALGAAGLVVGSVLVPALALIWLAHIGMDRLVGFGLKYPDDFGHSHLGHGGGRPLR